jgi:hypothetical protein
MPNGILVLTQENLERKPQPVSVFLHGGLGQGKAWMALNESERAEEAKEDLEQELARACNRAK